MGKKENKLITFVVMEKDISFYPLEDNTAGYVSQIVYSKYGLFFLRG